MATAIWQEVAKAARLPVERMPTWQIVTEKRATFAAIPSQENLRPGTRTRWSNLMLAGARLARLGDGDIIGGIAFGWTRGRNQGNGTVGERGLKVRFSSRQSLSVQSSRLLRRRTFAARNSCAFPRATSCALWIHHPHTPKRTLAVDRIGLTAKPVSPHLVVEKYTFVSEFLGMLCLRLPTGPELWQILSLSRRS
jgi:hypothetical protein